MLLALKMEDGARSQEMQVASRNQKRQGNGCSPRTSKGTRPVTTLILRLILDF